VAEDRTAAPDLRQLILNAPDDIWQKIKRALGTRTREEAAVMAQADPKAQQIVVHLLQGKEQQTEETLVTRRRPTTLVTAGSSGMEM
jgi:3'-phosphoadenosine 5'-phosphosulfate (PAPS) 3'-phosphatase